jgi:hypothetical protein
MSWVNQSTMPCAIKALPPARANLCRLAAGRLVMRGLPVEEGWPGVREPFPYAVKLGVHPGQVVGRVDVFPGVVGTPEGVDPLGGQ